MPGYEPFLLCDFHVHTTWSDGRLSLREVVDLYGQTGRFDVIAITDHILMKRDLLGRAGRIASLGLRDFSVTEGRFDAYLADIAAEAQRAQQLYDLLVDPRRRDHAEPHPQPEELAHRRAEHHASSSAPISRPRTSCEEIRAPGRVQHRLPPAPPDDAADRDRHLLSVGPPQAARRSSWTSGRRPTGTICSR